MYVTAVNLNQKNQIFNSKKLKFQTISFESKKFPSGIYSDGEFELAIKYAKSKGDKWEKELKDKYAQIRIEDAIDESENLFETLGCSKKTEYFLRIFMPTSNLANGMVKFCNTVKNMPKDPNIDKKWIDRMSKLVDDIRAGHKGKNI